MVWLLADTLDGKPAALTSRASSPETAWRVCKRDQDHLPKTFQAVAAKVAPCAERRASVGTAVCRLVERPKMVVAQLQE